MGIQFESQNLSFFLKRALAYIIDNVCVFFCSQIILFFLSSFITLTPNSSLNFSVILWAVYYIYMLGKYGYTFGKKLVGLKVIMLDNSPVTYKIAAYRFFATSLSALLLCLGFVMVLFNKKGISLHDKISGTVVLSNPIISLHEIV